MLTAMDSIMPLEPYQNLVKCISTLTNETVSFGMLAGGMILFIARHERGGKASAGARVGEITPPHRSAAGKAILAHVGEERRARILRRAVGSEVPDVLAAAPGNTHHRTRLDQFSQERMTDPEANRVAESVVTVQPDEEVADEGVLAAKFLAAAEPAPGETAAGKPLGKLTAGTGWDAAAVMATPRAGGRP